MDEQSSEGQNIFYLSFVFFLFLTSPSALAISTINDLTQQSLIGPNCAALLKEREAVCQALSPQTSFPKGKCTKSKKGQFQVSVKDCFPQDFLPYLGTPTRSSEMANCWGGALFASRLQPTPAYASEKLFTVILESPICQELSARDAEAPGDVIRIRQFGTDDMCNEDDLKNGPCEIHGMVWLTPNTVLSKNDSGSTSRLGIENGLNVFENWKVPKNCQNLSQKDAQGRCKNRFATRYRCKSLDHFVEKNKKELNEEDLLLLEQVRKFEKKIPTVFWESFPLDSADTLLMMGFEQKALETSSCEFEDSQGKRTDFRSGGGPVEKMRQKDFSGWSSRELLNLILCYQMRDLIIPNALWLKMYVRDRSSES